MRGSARPDPPVAEKSHKKNGNKNANKTFSHSLCLVLQDNVLQHATIKLSNLDKVDSTTTMVETMPKQHSTDNVQPTMLTPWSWYLSPSKHLLLRSCLDVLFLLKYCASDFKLDKRYLHEIISLPLVPLCNRMLGTI